MCCLVIRPGDASPGLVSGLGVEGCPGVGLRRLGLCRFAVVEGWGSGFHALGLRFQWVLPSLRGEDLAVRHETIVFVAYTNTTQVNSQSEAFRLDFPVRDVVITYGVPV